MKSLFQYFCIIAILALNLSGCASNSSDDVKLVAPSLRKHYPTLLDEAQKWKPDAYLNSSTIDIGLGAKPKAGDAWIRAHFLSPTEDFESVSISMSQSGAIKTETIKWQSPILRYVYSDISDDWQIDSLEALDIYLEEKKVRGFISSLEIFCGQMKLERFSHVEGQPAIWWLNINECLLNYDNKIELFMDANTGEIFEKSDLILLPPPTFTP